jgi:hypothetical protein
VDAVKKTTLAATLAIAGLLCAAALAAGPAMRAHESAAVKSCDARALRVTPAKTDVGRLRKLKRKDASRSKPRVYTVSADLVGMSRTGRAVELLLAEPGRHAETLVAAFPDGGCRKGTRLAKAMRRAQAALVKACGVAPKGARVRLEGAATLTGRASAPRSKAGPVELRPVLRFRATRCDRITAATKVAAPGAPASASPASAPSVPASEPDLEPQPEPEPPSDCTQTLSGGAIEAEANRAPDRVICLETAYYVEPRDALIVIAAEGVRIHAAPGAHPIVCGRFVVRGTGSSIAPDVRLDLHCAPYFNEDSPFNKVAAGYEASVPVPATWLADFDGTGAGPLGLSRTWDHGKAVFRASPADPVAATYRIADATQCFNDPFGCRKWQPVDPAHSVADDLAPVPELLPIPAGVRCPGLPLTDDTHDRSLTIVSADGRTAWELWHCVHAATPQEPYYEAAVAARWSLDPDDPSRASVGYQDIDAIGGSTNSVRGSGVPLLSTVLTPSEAIHGIHHPLGLTVAQISDGYLYPPASHSDGCVGCSHIAYGMLFVLEPGFQLPDDASIGEQNVVQALKKYGAYVVDRGPFELDGSPNEPSDPAASDQLWAAAGVELGRLGIKPSDLRYVLTPNAPPVIP